MQCHVPACALTYSVSVLFQHLIHYPTVEVLLEHSVAGVSFQRLEELGHALRCVTA